MRIQHEAAQPGTVAATRIALLPAAYTATEDFLREGFLNAVRLRRLPLDLDFVDVSQQHLTDRTILRRLRHEIILPARAVGCSSIWICGVSLGGFLALAYAERYPGEVDGLCLIAPYLGSRIVTSEIERARGIATWTPGELAPDDDERRVWQFIKTHQGQPTSLHLGYGKEDRFAHSHRMMGAAMSPEAVDVLPGGHDWPVWRQLWENFLETRLGRNLTAPAA